MRKHLFGIPAWVVLGLSGIFGCIPGFMSGLQAAFGLGVTSVSSVDNTSTADRFQETPCTVVVANNYDTHGTITRASVAHLTPAQIEAIFRPGGLFADMDSWFQTQFEMKACGTKTNGMFDWIMSSQRNMKGLLSWEKMDRGPSLLKPFILGRQESVINKDYWAITAGWSVTEYKAANGDDAAYPLTDTAIDAVTSTGTDRVVRVVTRYGMDLDAKWFVDRDRIHHFNVSGGQTLIGQWKVLGSAAGPDASFIDVVLTSENAGSSTLFDSTPTAGVVLAGVNNVNDYESFCQNRPTVDNRKRVPFWYQTMRRGRRVDSEYKLVFAKLMETNKYFQQFGDLSLAERNRQDEEEWQKRWVNAFFFNKKISSNQTMALWQSLDQITTVTGATVDPGLGGKLVAYRANFVGIFEQLQACGRVKDLQNNALNFYEFLNENYRIMRSRKSQGRVVETLDWFTDSEYAAQIETAFVNYLKAEYGDILRIEIETGKNELGFSWRIFKPKFPIGLKIAIVTHEFFDDMVSAFDTESIDSAGRVLLCLDIGKPGPKGGTIYPGMIASNKKVHTLGELNNLARLDATFACTMEHITEEISLTSETATAVCECPSNSLWIMGIKAAVPVTTGKTANPSYTDLY